MFNNLCFFSSSVFKNLSIAIHCSSYSVGVREWRAGAGDTTVTMLQRGAGGEKFFQTLELLGGAVGPGKAPLPEIRF